MFNRLFLWPLMFEFSRVHQADYGRGRDFIVELDRFLGELPRGEGWEFGVEIGNKTWLEPEYSAMLRSHSVANVFNNSTKRTSVLEQLDTASSQALDISRRVIDGNYSLVMHLHQST